MIIECPHCYSKVVPNPQGECPSCRKNTRDKNPQDVGRTSLTVAHAAALPKVCCRCAGETDAYVKITRKISRKKDPDSSSEPLWLLGLFLSWIFWLLALLRGDFRERFSDVIVVHMPHCPRCQAEQPLEPIRINSEELQMTFVVHQDFKDLNLSRLNRPAGIGSHSGSQTDILTQR